MRKVAPSLLAADFLHLDDEIDFINNCADILHLDVMDGIFVPNISFGFPVIEAVAKKSVKPLDVHLMIVNPEKYFERFVSVGAEMLSFHLEACGLCPESVAGKAASPAETKNPSLLLKQIRDLGAKAGLVINPDVPVEMVFPYLKDADFILIMSVFAGFGGQKFIPETYERIAILKSEIDRQGVSCIIEIDGGVDSGNAGELAAKGAEILVAGSSVFKASDRAAAVEAIRTSK